MKETSKQILVELGTAVISIIMKLYQRRNDSKKEKKGEK